MMIVNGDSRETKQSGKPWCSCHSVGRRASSSRHLFFHLITFCVETEKQTEHKWKKFSPIFRWEPSFLFAARKPSICLAGSEMPRGELSVRSSTIDDCKTIPKRGLEWEICWPFRARRACRTTLASVCRELISKSLNLSRNKHRKLMCGRWWGVTVRIDLRDVQFDATGASNQKACDVSIIVAAP